MIDNNNFYIENLNSVVFIGYSDVFSELIKINDLLKIKSLIVTCSDQSKLINKKIDYKIFDKLDNKFKEHIKKKVNVKNTIFVSLSARYIFTKDLIEKFFLNNLVNFHRSRLPLDAGGGGFSWRFTGQAPAGRYCNRIAGLLGWRSGSRVRIAKIYDLTRGGRSPDGHPLCPSEPGAAR